MKTSKHCLVAIPERASERDLSEIAGLFPPSVDASVVHGDRSALSLEKIGSTGVPFEFSSWLIVVAPHVFKDLAVSALTLYAGKKFLDGFATEAGKDLWLGIIACASWLQERLRSGNVPSLEGTPVLEIVENPPRRYKGVPLKRIKIDIPSQPDVLTHICEDHLGKYLFPLTQCLDRGGFDIYELSIGADTCVIRLGYTRSGDPVDYDLDFYSKHFCQRHTGRSAVAEHCFRELGFEEDR